MDILEEKQNNISNLKKSIQNFARELGFEKVGFALPSPLKKDFEYYNQWLSLGYNASMDYLERNLDKRKNVELILPEVKSVIVFAHSYYTGIEHKNNFLKISRYAWGKDYHKVIAKKLECVVEFLSSKYKNFKAKIYVDTGPILEKYWAVISGIGWQGKNSLVLNKELGSYFFIGILLTNIEFEPDPKVEDHCGKCTRCIDACPTGAIVQPKVIDSRKCISFWTIEKKREEIISESVDLNGWIFGCDICQEVCPWNKKAKITKETDFYPDEIGTNLTEEIILNLTEENFRNIFKNSAIKRAKYQGLLKNYFHILRKKCTQID
ncbi:MAG: tRNA epoxyqueuosine(34) reductase QueG [Ignavibacteria bacterium]|nr:tRNA epoxyqueuosine(34) reductase QueG [Ignavibacteria bacterium]